MKINQVEEHKYYQVEIFPTPIYQVAIILINEE